MAGAAAEQAFSRAQARRLLDVSERQLRGWEKQKLIPESTSYGFRQIVGLRTLAMLRAKHIPPAQIRRALQAVSQKLRHVGDPLAQLKISVDGRKIHVEVEGRPMDAESGQLLFNFDAQQLNRLVQFEVKPKASEQRDQRAAAEHWFQKGLDLEQTGAPAKQIIEAYEKALELDPNSAGALVNLGTIYFNARRWRDAERYYRAAITADPQYALAHFDLANLYDERGQRDKALEHYQTALKVAPNYADAHYNIALLYQGSNQPLKAVHHWRTYLKLDPGSQWAQIARRELAKVRDSAVVRGARP